MISSHFFGDLALAVLLSVPVVAVAATSHAVHDVNPVSLTKQTTANQSPVEDRFTLLAPN